MFAPVLVCPAPFVHDDDNDDNYDVDDANDNYLKDNDDDNDNYDDDIFDGEDARTSCSTLEESSKPEDYRSLIFLKLKV